MDMKSGKFEKIRISSLLNKIGLFLLITAIIASSFAAGTTVDPSISSCIDSDGEDQYNYGSIKEVVNGEWIITLDTCRDEFTAEERICDNGRGANKYFDCKNGCADGICNPDWQCKDDSDCPVAQCICEVGKICNCPIFRCIDGKCVIANPTKVQETVTCNFPGASRGYECSSDYGSCYAQPMEICSNSGLCKTVTQCTVEVGGEKGTKIAWNAMNCGATGSSIIDGTDETVNFNCVNIEPVCKETDSGYDIFNKGETRSGSLRKIDYCLDNSIVLNEYYCSESGKIADSQVNCEYGCRDGACIQPSSYCTDSDGGINYNQYGIVETSNGVIGKDQCSNSNSNVLIEYFCDGEKPNSLSYSCPYGCGRGVCKSKITEQVTCVFYNPDEPEKCYSSYGSCTAYPINYAHKNPACVVNSDGTTVCPASLQSTCTTSEDGTATECAVTSSSGSVASVSTTPVAVSSTGSTVAASSAVAVSSSEPIIDSPSVNNNCVISEDGTTTTCHSPLYSYCTIDVSGTAGDNIKWESSCGGSARTVLDGRDEKIEFNCVQNTVKDAVTCVFHGSSTEQKCYTAGDNNRAYCTGTGKCTTEIKGFSGEDITWKSTCGGYVQQRIDGSNDILDFYCDTVKEQVKCVFHGSSQEQSCYTTDMRASCSGSDTCVADINGFSGEQITWKSTCGGYDYTIVDGNFEYAEFFCSGSNTSSYIDVAMRENEQYTYSRDKSGWSIILNTISDNTNAAYISIEVGLLDENKREILSLKESDTVEYKGLFISLLGIGNDASGLKMAKLRFREASTSVSTVQLGTSVHVNAKAPIEKDLPSIQATSEVDCQGCYVNGKCIPYGIRTKNGEAKYCELSGGFELQKEENKECSNNFECVSNYCSNAKCVNLIEKIDKQQGMLDKISYWLKSLLGLA